MSHYRVGSVIVKNFDMFDLGKSDGDSNKNDQTILALVVGLKQKHDSNF